MSQRDKPRLALNNITAGVREPSEWSGGPSDIEGKTTRVGASEYGQRTSFNRTREAGHLDEIQGIMANTLDLFRNGASLLANTFGVGFIDWLGHGRCELECDSIANSISAAILRRPLEPPNEDTAVDFNDSTGSNVVWVRRDFDVFQPLSASMFQHQFQRQLGIAAAFLPWHNRIANVSEDVRGQL